MLILVHRDDIKYSNINVIMFICFRYSVLINNLHKSILYNLGIICKINFFVSGFFFMIIVVFFPSYGRSKHASFPWHDHIPAIKEKINIVIVIF